MSRIFVSLTVLLLFANEGYAQRWRPVPAPMVSVPAPRQQEAKQQEPKVLAPKPLNQAEVDSAEIKRWGNRVSITDGISAKQPDELLQSMANSPPVDDNDMWQMTIFGPSEKVKSPYSVQTSGLIHAFEQDPYLAPYVAPNPMNGNRAWAHCVVIHSDDVMQQWRLQKFNIDPNGAFPVVTLQAPRNGHKGDPSVIVDRIDLAASGIKASTSPEALAKRLESSVALWSKKLAKQGFQPPVQAVDNFYKPVRLQEPQKAQALEVKTVGHGHGQTEPSPTTQAIGAGAPPWGPVAPPPATPFNPQWPINGPAQPQSETLDLATIQQMCPGAPADFLIQVYGTRPTDKNQVALAWLVYQQQHAPVQPSVAPAVVPATPVAPVVPVVPPTNPLNTVAAISMVIVAFLKIWENIAPMFGFSGTVAKMIEELITQLQVVLPRQKQESSKG